MTRYIWQREDWPRFTWNTERIQEPLSACRLAQGRLIGKVAGLGTILANEAQAEILIEECLKTLAIEGEHVDPDSVRTSVAQRLGSARASLPTEPCINSLVSVLCDATQDCESPLSAERLWGWQETLFSAGYTGRHRIRIGNWRDGVKPMRVVSRHRGRKKIHYEAPASDQVAREMELFLIWWRESRGNLDGIIRAAVAHFWFITIHPFGDGNGRLARALTDMALAQDDQQPVRAYSMSTQIMEDHEGYYKILEKCQKGSCDITKWLLWFLGCFTRGIQRSEEILAGVFGPHPHPDPPLEGEGESPRSFTG